MTLDYEARVQAVYESLLGPGDTAIDVGAQLGRHSIPMARRVAPTGQVLAFEPLGMCRDRLSESLARDVPELAPVITIHGCALADYSGSAEFHVAVDAIACSGLRPRPYDVPTAVERAEVEVRRLDEFGRDLPSLKYIKIDAEGGELHVLRGAAHTIARFRPAVTFEFGVRAVGAYGVTASEMADFWLERGYRIFDVLGRALTTRDAFVASATGQQVWDYIALPAEASSWTEMVMAGLGGPDGRGSIEAEMKEGYRMLIDPAVPEQMAAGQSGVYEQPLLSFALRLIPDGGVFLDVGANVGFYACAIGVALRDRGGRVFAFEPEPSTRRRLEENVRRNGLENVVTVLPYALGRERGRLVIRRIPTGETANAVGENMFSDWDRRTVEKEGWARAEAVLVRLDDWAAGLDRCDVIKIDTEGADLFVLLGGTAAIARFRPVVLAEFNPYWMRQVGQGLDDVRAFCRSMRYEIHRLFGEGFLPLAPDYVDRDGEAPSYVLVPVERREVVAPSLRNG